MANVTLPQLTRDQAIDAWKALHDTLQSDPVISHLMTSGIHEGLQAQRLLTQRFARAGAKLLNTGGGVDLRPYPNRNPRSGGNRQGGHPILLERGKH